MTNTLKNFLVKINPEKHPSFARFCNDLTYFKSIKSFCLQHRYHAIVKEKYYISSTMIDLPAVKNAYLTAITIISQEMGNTFGKQKINCQAMKWETAYANEWFYIRTPLVNARFCLVAKNLMEIQFYATKRAYKMNLFEKGRLFKSLKSDLAAISDKFEPIPVCREY